MFKKIKFDFICNGNHTVQNNDDDYDNDEGNDDNDQDHDDDNDGNDFDNDKEGANEKQR